MNMLIRCVCGKPPGHAVRLHTTDADSRLDPTGTSKVRAAFQRDMDRRWTQVKALLMKSIKDRFTNSGLNVSHAALTGQSPVVAFQAHVDEALRQLVLGYNGSWTARYVRDGARVGAERAAKLVQDAGPDDEPRDEQGRWSAGGGGDTNVYHGTKHEFDKLQVDPKEDFMLDRMLGVHVARDPEIAGSFTINRQTGESLPGSRIIPLVLENKKFLQVPQKQYDSGILESDQTAIDKMVMGVAYHKDPEMLSRYLTSARAIPKDQAPQLANDLAAGKTIQLPNENRPRNLDQFIDNLTGARPFSVDDRKRAIALAKEEWSKQGYHGLRYTNTAPMETGHSKGQNKPKDLISYVVFEPRHLTQKFTGYADARDATPPDRTPILQQLVISELRGICEAAAQQMVRAYGVGLLSSATPMSTAQGVGAVIDKVGRARSRALVQFSIVRAHAMATLDGFRASGVSHVGTVAERTRSAPAHGLVRDAVFPSRKVVRAENKLKRVFGKSKVDVLTAGDDRVCPECEDISNEGPYTLDQAEGLIPAHPNCRCSFVPAEDARFASVHDAPRLADSTTHIAAGVMILDPYGRALFLKRSTNGDHAGEWAFPAGAVEPGETAEMAAARETQEELGFTPTDLEQIDRRETDGVDFTTFSTMVTGKFVPTLDHEHTDWCWRSLTNPPEPLHPGVRATVEHAVLGVTVDAFDPDEPRDPQGKWTAGGGSLTMSDLTKISGKMGSNEGGVYSPNRGDLENLGKQYYIKQPTSPDHVQNELIAAKLYQLAGVHTLNYVPVKGGEHVATELEVLAKNNVKDLDPAERDAAKSDFAVHAWLANWDAVGTGGDNVGLRKDGSVVTLDTGGSLKYRAQGEPKGAAFGNTVDEINTLRDPSKSPDAAKLYGDMTNEQIVSSINRVTKIPDSAIIDAVVKQPDGSIGSMPLAQKLIARKHDLASQAAKMSTPSAFDPEPQPTTNTAPPAFKTKMEHAKHLLMKGTTSDELKKSLNWPAIGVPATAASLNLKLEKTKVGGAFFYKGTPMTPEEIKVAKAAKSSTVTPSAPSAPPVSAPVKTNGSKPQDFHNALQAAGVPTGDLEKLINGNWKISAPTLEAEKMAAVAKNHPEWKLNEGMVATYTAPSSAFGDNNLALTKANSSSEMFGSPASSNPDKHLVTATQAELDKAKKNTKLTAQYVPGAPTNNPAAQDLIDKFNIKWHGIEPWSSSIPEQAKAGEALLHEKVADFKKLQSAMVPLASAQAQAEATAKASQLSSAASKKALAAKAEADKLANLHNLPEEEQREYWFKKAIGGPHYYQQAQDDIASKSKGPKLEKMGVTTSEVAFIKAFTGSHSGVNAELIKGSMSEEQLAYKSIMNEALDKMHKYDGPEVYRKISLTPEQQNDYTVGNIKHWTNFSSTSKDKATWIGNTHFTIKNPKTGVDVQFISVNAGEKEVIMPADTYYKVLSKTKNQDVYGNANHGITHIVLEEVVPTFGKKKKAA